MDSSGAIKLCEAFQEGACPELKVLHVSDVPGAQWQMSFLFSRHEHVNLIIN